MSAVNQSYRRCQALNRVGSQCRNAGTAYHPLNAHHEALLCPGHQRQAREGQVRVAALQALDKGMVRLELARDLAILLHTRETNGERSKYAARCSAAS